MPVKSMGQMSDSALSILLQQTTSILTTPHNLGGNGCCSPAVLKIKGLFKYPWLLPEIPIQKI